ncbi:MAG: hypothetical protein GY810_23735 [Aureispira sp.]|nr:hypothetical protein [Aureispira sp.]
MKNLYLILFLSCSYLLSTQAQDITQDQQNLAFEYIEFTQAQIATLNQLQIDHNNRVTQGGYDVKEYQKVVVQADRIVAELKAKENVEKDFDYKRNVLIYANSYNQLIKNYGEEVYQKKAEVQAGCTQCIPYQRAVYDLYMADIKEADIHYDKLTESLAAFAGYYLIELPSSEEANAAIDKFRASMDYVVDMNLTVLHTITSYNKMAKALQAVFSGKAKVATLETLSEDYNKAIKGSKEYFATIKQKAFEKDQTVWDGAKNLLAKCEVISQSDLPKLIELIKKKEAKEQLTSTEKEELQKLLTNFSAIVKTLRRYEQIRANFLNKYIQQIPR